MADAWTREVVRIAPADESAAISQWRDQCDCELSDIARLGDLHIVRNLLSDGEGQFRAFRRVDAGGTRVLLVTNPNMMAAVLRYPRGRHQAESPFGGLRNTRDASALIGDCLLTAGPSKHDRLKRSAASALSSRACDHYQSQLFDLAEHHLACMRQEAANASGISTLEPFGVFSTDAAASILLRVQIDAPDLYHELNASLSSVQEGGVHTDSVPTPQLTKATNQYIQGDSPLACALQGQCTRSASQAMAKLMLFAGFDTVASLTTSLIWTMGNEGGRAYQRELAAELAGDPTGRLISSGRLESVIDESLRLFPPGVQGRITLSPIQIGESLLLPPHTEVRLHHFFAQRDPCRWGPNAEEFYPSRHTRRQPFGRADVFAFSGGATPCLGALFARMQTRALVVGMLRAGAWTSLGSGLGLSGDYIIRPAAGARIRLK